MATSKRLGNSRKLWSASEIVERLEALHPDFFPVPFIAKITGPHSSHLGVGPPNALTKGDLLSLYGKCGGVLHRGTRAKLLSAKMPKQTNFTDIKGWADALRDLLQSHIILTLEGRVAFFCEMGAGPDGGPRTQIGVAPGPSRRVP